MSVEGQQGITHVVDSVRMSEVQRQLKGEYYNMSFYDGKLYSSSPYTQLNEYDLNFDNGGTIKLLKTRKLNFK